MAWGLFRYRLFNIMPVARAQVFEGMEQGMIVLDDQDRVVDLNPAARRRLGRERIDPALGRKAADALAGWPTLVALTAEPAVTSTELVLPPAEPAQSPGFTLQPPEASSAAATEFPSGFPDRVICARISALTGSRSRYLGRVIILNDITDRMEAEARLARQRPALAVLEKRERLARELHDSLGQVLGYVSVQIQAAIQALLARDRHRQAGEQLQRLADAAQADMREYIAGVRASDGVRRDSGRPSLTYSKGSSASSERSGLLVPA